VLRSRFRGRPFHSYWLSLSGSVAHGGNECCMSGLFASCLYFIHGNLNAHWLHGQNIFEHHHVTLLSCGVSSLSISFSSTSVHCLGKGANLVGCPPLLQWDHKPRSASLKKSHHVSSKHANEIGRETRLPCPPSPYVKITIAQLRVQTFESHHSQCRSKTPSQHG
jgi:hypothetical protein